MVDLCSLLAHGELTSGAFAEWSARHYGPVLGASQVQVLLEDFDGFVAKLSSTELSKSLLRLRPVISRLARAVHESSEGATTDRRDELLTALAAPSGESATRQILAWTSRHYGEPRSMEPSLVGTLIADFDAVLTSAGSEENEFTRAILRIRDVLARRAESAPTSTITLTEGPEGVTAEATPPDPHEPSRWMRSDAITFSLT